MDIETFQGFGKGFFHPLDIPVAEGAGTDIIYLHTGTL